MGLFKPGPSDVAKVLSQARYGVIAWDVVNPASGGRRAFTAWVRGLPGDQRTPADALWVCQEAYKAALAKWDLGPGSTHNMSLSVSCEAQPGEWYGIDSNGVEFGPKAKPVVAL